MSDAASQDRPPSSADILLRLEAEQRAFRAVMAGLGVLLVLVALIVAGSMAVSYVQLRDLRAETVNLRSEAAEANAAEHIALGETLRQQESMRMASRALSDEFESSRRNIDVLQRLDGMASDAERVAYAERLAAEHLTGAPLDWSTQEVLARALEARDEDGALMATGDVRLLIEAARADWTRQPQAAELLFRELAENAQSARMRGLGVAGLAQRTFDVANAQTDLEWERGCGEAVELAEEALSLGASGPNLLYIKGQCQRKNGRTEEAYATFIAQRDMVEAQAELYDHAWLPYRYQSAHGVGTTLIALGADLPPGELIELGGERFDPRARAIELLTRAAGHRRDYGASDVGVAYTNENLGIIHLQRGDWDAALGHTAQIDAVIALAWNLTVRHIAAREKLATLGEDADPAVRGELEAIADDARIKLATMRSGYFDQTELEKLLPAPLRHYVAELIAPSREREETDEAEG